MLKRIVSRTSFSSDLIHSRWITTLGFFLSILVAAGVWYATEYFLYKRAQNLFEHYAHDNSEATDRRIHRYENALRSGVGFMQGSSYVSRQEWRQFVQTLDPEKYYNGMQGIGFSIMLTPEQVSAMEEQMRREGFSSFALRPEGKRERYSAILYLEPLDKRNHAAIGYDMYSEPIRREAMQRAADTGAVSVSGKVTLVQEIDKEVQAGCLMYLPYYKPGEPVSTVDERRRALIGFVYSPFRMNDLMRALGQHDESMQVEIYDGPHRSDNHLLYRSGSTEYMSEHTAHETIKIGGRIWHLYYSSTPKYDQSKEVSFIIFAAMGGLGLYFILLYTIVELLKSRKKLQSNTVELESSRSWLQKVLESSVDGIHILDFDGNLIECSPSFLQMFGYNEHEAQALSVYDWEAKLSDTEIRTALDSISIIPVTFETVCRRKDGILLDVEITAHRIDVDGVQYIYASGREITERKKIERLLKESEEFYRTMFSSINEAVCILSENRIIDCNDEAVRLFEMMKQQMIGMNIFDVVTQIECREHNFPFYLNAAYRGESATAVCSVSLSAHSNERKIIEFTLSGFGRSNTNKLILIARDMTEQIEQERLFKMQTRQAQMGEMISMIAHQWRQPLAIINAITSQMRLQELMKEENDPLLIENLIKIEEQSVHLSRTITDYRDFFRPDKPKELFYISTLIDHALSLIDHTLKNYGITIQKVLVQDPKLITYRNELLQVLIALLKNALDAFGENHVSQGTITIGINQDDHFVIVSIHDNAGGIAPDIMKKLFIPYFTTKHKSGTGLGLYMSKVIIEEHCAGVLEVSSEENVTTFIIKLPYEKEEK